MEWVDRQNTLLQIIGGLAGIGALLWAVTCVAVFAALSLSVCGAYLVDPDGARGCGSSLDSQQSVRQERSIPNCDYCHDRPGPDSKRRRRPFTRHRIRSTLRPRSNRQIAPLSRHFGPRDAKRTSSRSAAQYSLHANSGVPLQLVHDLLVAAENLRIGVAHQLDRDRVRHAACKQECRRAMP
jgi:hypothetical protein